MLDEGDWGNRVAVLAVRHKETGPDFTIIRNPNIFLGHGSWTEQPFELRVDFGLAGLFDDAHYQADTVFDGMKEPEHDFGDLWYNHACDITLSRMQAGVMPFGVVSSSGFGDGGYVCYTHEGDTGEIDFAFIVFIDE